MHIVEYDMFSEQPFRGHLVPAFRFGESSEALSFVRKMLMRGHSFEICEQVKSGERKFSLSMSSERESYERLFQFARIGEPVFGTYMQAFQPTIALSVRSHASEILNETLDSGFPAFLLAEKDLRGKSTGNFTLLVHACNNS